MCLCVRDGEMQAIPCAIDALTVCVHIFEWFFYIRVLRWLRHRSVYVRAESAVCDAASSMRVLLY